jgi:hypothetical protein
LLLKRERNYQLLVGKGYPELRDFYFARHRDYELAATTKPWPY